MKAAIELATTILLALACLVVIGVGSLEFKARWQVGSAPRGNPAPAAEVVNNLDVSIADMQVKGSRGASLLMIEFSDFQCPFCGRYARDTFKNIERDFVSTGKVAYVAADFPLNTIHPFAFKAAEAAECAAPQGKYWEMHDRLFENQSQLTFPDLLKHADAVGLQEGRFLDCMNKGMADALGRQSREGKRAGVNSTPVFLIGRFTSPTSARIVRRVAGAQPYQSFHDLLNELLAAQ